VRQFIADDRLRWHAQPSAFVPASRALQAEALTAAAHLDCPTLVLLAAADRIVDNARVVAALPGAEVRKLAGGHAVLLETPDTMAQIICDWLP
jgi:pimeloyl-ACP methyl ester carboxylesterase